MDGYSSKLSLYDFIVMLMPGSIIAYCLTCLFISESDVIRMDNPFFWILFFVVSYFLGIANHIISSCMFKSIGFRNCQKMLRDSIQRANKNGYVTDVDMEKIKEQKCLKDKYYQAYYYAKKNGYGNDIEIMESQVAFLQSLFCPVIIILFLSIFPCVDLSRPLNLQIGLCDCRCLYIVTIWIGSLITMFLAISLMISRQKKIYDRVWEDYHYLKNILK